MEVLMIKPIQNKNVWNGRIDEDDPMSVRYHQIVTRQELSTLQINHHNHAYGIVGFSCDEGVRRNKGRIGAAKAPDAIRQHLANLPYHMHSGARTVDIGNIVCEGDALERAQRELGMHVAVLVYKNSTPSV